MDRYRETAHRLEATAWRRLRRRYSSFSLAALTGLCAAHQVSAQGGAAPSQGGSSAAQPAVNVSQTLDTMKGDLRRLVGANQVYFADKGRYNADVSALRGYHPSSGVTVNIVDASSTGWAAVATAATVPGKSCVIAVGTVARPPTTLADKRSGPEAVAVCDTP
jgi:hypothetical protein